MVSRAVIITLILLCTVVFAVSTMGLEHGRGLESQSRQVKRIENQRMQAFACGYIVAMMKVIDDHEPIAPGVCEGERDNAAVYGFAIYGKAHQ